jgi:hypothetical protein
MKTKKRTRARVIKMQKLISFFAARAIIHLELEAGRTRAIITPLLVMANAT